MYLEKNNFHSKELLTHLLILEFGVQYPKVFMTREKKILLKDSYSQVVTSYHLISAIKSIYVMELCMTRTTSVPKSVLCYLLDKGQFISLKR